jgi:hypothetical protein
MNETRAPQRPLSSQRKLFSAVSACSAVVLFFALWSRPLSSHETLTTTVLFDREIVRILDKHCVRCHVENGPSFPLETYEQTQVLGRKIRSAALARHMPPWAAVQGYGQFANDNSLTLRETQFIVSWVEGLGPRNAGTVFANVVTAGPRPPAVRAHADFGFWQLGQPELARQVAAELGPATPTANAVTRAEIDLGLAADRHLRAIEYMPGNRRALRAVVFTVKETGQWLGGWTPWHGAVTLPAGVTARLPAGSHLVAEIHYRGSQQPASERGTLGLFFAEASRSAISDLVFNRESNAPSSLRSQTLKIERRLAADTHVWAVWPELRAGLQSLELAAKTPNGATDVLLFAKDFPLEWPTPYVFATPALLRKGTTLTLTAHFADAQPARPDLRVVVSKY